MDRARIIILEGSNIQKKVSKQHNVLICYGYSRQWPKSNVHLYNFDTNGYLHLLVCVCIYIYIPGIFMTFYH